MNIFCFIQRYLTVYSVFLIPKYCEWKIHNHNHGWLDQFKCHVLNSCICRPQVHMKKTAGELMHLYLETKNGKWLRIEWNDSFLFYLVANQSDVKLWELGLFFFHQHLIEYSYTITEQARFSCLFCNMKMQVFFLIRKTMDFVSYLFFYLLFFEEIDKASLKRPKGCKNTLKHTYFGFKVTLLWIFSMLES